MKINLINKIVCRTPAFSTSDRLPVSLAELKLKIAESSPGFAELIEQLDATDLPKLEDRVWFTLWKYFNRSVYRSTPFGSFAAISVLPVHYKASHPIVIERQLDALHAIDWSQKDVCIANREISLDSYFFINSSCYHIGDEIRYIRLKDHVHELAAVKAIPIVVFLYKLTKEKTTCAEICNRVLAKFGLAQNTTINILKQLMDMQMLTSSMLPNITGQDYFERIDFRQTHRPTDYIIANRGVKSGSFEGTTLKTLPELFTFLAKHLPQYTNGDLEDFKSKFVKRYEQQEVELSLALDPAIGIGYGNSAQQFGSNELIEELKNARFKQTETAINYGELQLFLLQQMLKGDPIQLENFEGKGQDTTAIFPNTFSTMFHLYRSNPVITMAGGCTANALLGRFTMKNTSIEELTTEISAIETKANEAVAFFDVAYQAEKRVDNVNRRKMLYPFELPILSWSTTAHPLTFEDILVSISNNQIILRSRSLGVRLVPRIPSAYNYNRSDLSAFRFLCDLQYQGLKSQLSFRLRDFFPDLAYYPRVSYKTIIVSPAAWLLPASIFSQFKTNERQALIDLQHWMEEKQINFRFKVGEADHTLCFDTQQTDDLKAFAIYCKQQPKCFYLTEMLIDDQDLIEDETGKKYFPQYIASYHHSQTIYANVTRLEEPATATNRIHVPGGEWLYFEIYCHPTKSESILLNQLYPLTKKYSKSIKKWFFIRYSDPSNHLRWRLQLKTVYVGLKLMQALKTTTQAEVLAGNIIDVKIRTYKREIERYGIKQIDLVEDIFCTDSTFVIFLLRKSTTENQLIASSMKIIERIMDLFIPSLDQQLLFVKDMAQRFADEMSIGPEHFKKLNLSFNQFQHEIEKLAIAPPRYLWNAYIKKINMLLKSLESVDRGYQLLADLIHMHINRVFTIDQRMYETMIYHYLNRELQRKRATGTLISVKK